MRAEENAHGAIAPITWVVGGILCVLICVGLLFVFAILTANEILPNTMSVVLPPLAVLVASFISSYMSCKAHGRALITSLIQGIFNLGLCYIMGMVVFLRIVPKNLNPYCFFACMVGAILGGLLSAGVRPRRHKIK